MNRQNIHGTQVFTQSHQILVAVSRYDIRLIGVRTFILFIREKGKLSQKRARKDQLGS